MFQKGYVQVYTGNGKGKTTAAIGLAIRALGAGKRVLFLQFMKTKVYSEHNILPQISSLLTLETLGKPFFIVKEGTVPDEELAKWGDDVVIFPPGKPPQEYLEIMRTGIERARQAVSSGCYDLVVLDELNVALFFDLVTWRQVKDIIDHKAESVELVLTGRGAPQELIERADLVTEMREVKHYYQHGVEARIGIEN
ncbi:cob(I)yrinic acid a,c-diamide adenosyltransferase [bacterium BFN5]|nr:cob(I)yrinic acid a,c-diamide adenosyltransferase [bacterium BFN5]QJW45425.1 cob(I)yrinic acid a,c-diamide adenosyltransferase [bacterium BFN5]